MHFIWRNTNISLYERFGKKKVFFPIQNIFVTPTVTFLQGDLPIMMSDKYVFIITGWWETKMYSYLI